MPPDVLEILERQKNATAFICRAVRLADAALGGLSQAINKHIEEERKK